MDETTKPAETPALQAGPTSSPEPQQQWAARAEAFELPLGVDDAGTGDEDEELEEAAPAAAPGAPDLDEDDDEPSGGRAGVAKCGPKMRVGQLGRLRRANGKKPGPEEWARTVHAEAEKARAAAGLQPVAWSELPTLEPAGVGDCLARLRRLTGKRTTGQDWAEALTREAARVRSTLGPAPAASSEDGTKGTGGAPGDGASSTAAPGPEGSSSGEAAPRQVRVEIVQDEAASGRILGQPAERVLPLLPLSAAVWGRIAARCEGTPNDFAGTREITVLEGTPWERTLRANFESQLVVATAAVGAKYTEKAGAKMESPEVVLGLGLLGAFGPQNAHLLKKPAELVVGLVARIFGRFFRRGEEG